MSTVTYARKTVNVMEVAEVVKEIANVEDTVMLAQLTAAITHVPNVKQAADSVTENVAAARRTAAGAQFVPTVSKIATVEIDVLKITTGAVRRLQWKMSRDNRDNNNNNNYNNNDNDKNNEW